ncbi:MAG: alpha-glucan family phosphorylase [Thermoflexales bacterium]|nr:alpha-glucan family phosphorylase [Thermoflexales bacterium]
MTRPIFTYNVAPSLPAQLEPLRELAYNVLWSWDHELLELFIRMDRDLWEKTNHNPMLLLGSIKQDRLNSTARDDAFLAQLERAWEHYLEYMNPPSNWCQRVPGMPCEPFVAYFSAEFGLTECLPNYSGGLGVLSGDHLKSASDLGLPLVGVGLLYQQGYFRQYLNADGWQQESYPENDFFTLPVRPERDADKTPITISIEYPWGPVYAQIWRVQVGRIPLYLLDANIEANAPSDRDITDQLYGGDREMRIKQEIMLGIGGYRALQAVGMQPMICHINEGHAAFLALERCRGLMEKYDLSFDEAREAASAGTVFTTHTPVPAGNDYFVPELIDKYFAPLYDELGLTRQEFLALGRQNPDDERESFCMTILALRMSEHSNGVSRLHGDVSRQMWQNVWPGIPPEDTPIAAITNGVHAPSWISRDMASLFDRYLGPRWRGDPGDLNLWARVHQIPDEELWRTHERRRERLVAFARSRLRSQLEAHGAPPSEVAQASEILNPEALTIGFARRFATYKRATLVLHDIERITRILTDINCPVQIIFAGKAHPHDNPGKEIIRQIVHFARRPDMRRHVVFIEDYDITVARYLVQGVDIWLNTPRRPLEASGTSGMKATLNGALNLSVLDGWWVEGYNVDTGWAIGQGEEYEDHAYQNEVEAHALYTLLEKEVVPLFYTRGTDGLPRAWISRMKSAMRSISPIFNTNRMVRQYTEEFYLPALERYRALIGDDLKRARLLTEWKEKASSNWPALKIVEITSEVHDEMTVGDTLVVRAWLELGELTPDDVRVELYHGAIDADGEILWPKITPLGPTGQVKRKRHEFVGAISTATSGRHGYTVRVLPRHPDLGDPYKQDLILWAQ